MPSYVRCRNRRIHSCGGEAPRRESAQAVCSNTSPVQQATLLLLGLLLPLLPLPTLLLPLITELPMSEGEEDEVGDEADMTAADSLRQAAGVRCGCEHVRTVLGASSAVNGVRSG